MQHIVPGSHSSANLLARALLSLPAYYTLPQALTPRPCMLSQVQENWAGESFEFALCVRLPYFEMFPRLTMEALHWCSLPKSLHRSILAFTFTDCWLEQIPGVEYISKQFIGGEWEGWESLIHIGCL